MFCVGCNKAKVYAGAQFPYCEQCLILQDIQPEPLKVTTICVQQVDEDDFSSLVSLLHKRPYKLQQQGELMGQGEIRTYDAHPNPEAESVINQWKETPVPSHLNDARDIELWWEREHYPEVESVLSDLVNRGLLEEGTCNIHAWW